jgi:hypothetical protein
MFHTPNFYGTSYETSGALHSRIFCNSNQWSIAIGFIASSITLGNSEVSINQLLSLLIFIENKTTIALDQFI